MSARCSGLYREVSQQCGPDVARALFAHYAGAMIKVPRRVEPDHILAQRLGLEIAQRLCAAFAGEQIEVPTQWLRGRELMREVARLLAAGMTVNDIARELRVTRAHVHQIKKRIAAGGPCEEEAEAEAPRQMSLFKL